MISRLPWFVRSSALALVLLLALSACLVKKGSRSYGSDVLTKEPKQTTPAAGEGAEQSAAGAGGQGVLMITLIDPNGLHPEGVLVQIAGGIDKTLVSDRNGKIQIEGPSGYYTYQVQVGCNEAIEVHSGGTGRSNVVTGQTTTAIVPVEWRHRLAPSTPVYADYTPYWPPGQEVTVRYDVVDRCVQGHPRIPGATYPTYSVQLAGNLRLTSKPVMKADGDGFGYVKVTCTAEGPAELFILDSKNPKDRLDLVASDLSGGGQETPTCRRVS